MKTRLFFLAIVLCMFTTLVNAQVTITLQPGAGTGKDSDIRDDNPSTPNGVSPDFIANAWSAGGSFIQRSLVEFDFTSIPQNATIISATLSLYANPTSGHSQHHSSLSGSNECYLKRITGAWSENTVCWNNQPNTTDVNKVLIPQSSSSLQNYPNIDVTQLVQDMIDFPNSHGFMLMLKTESQFRAMIFASSDNQNSALHPKIVITYDTISGSGNDTCIYIKTNKDLVFDADIRDDFPNTPNGLSPDFIANAWTVSGNAFVQRSLLRIDVSNIPQNATITSARLTLYANPTTGHPQHHSGLSGSNICYLRKLTSAWDENTVCWNNQPGYTNNHEVQLPASLLPLEDYYDIDVMEMFQDFVNTPATNFGMVLMLETEQEFRSMIFASQDHVDSTFWPELSICYSTNVGIESRNRENFKISVFPNPVGEYFYITLTGNEKKIDKVELLSSIGTSVKSFNDLNGDLLQNHKFSVDDVVPGLYLVKVYSKNEVFTGKFIKL